ncbi:hypothetical protein Tco_1203268 [Tanacetum coccineum]
MPTNIKLYDGTTDLEDHLNRFASAANSEEWPMPGGVCRKVFSSEGIFKEPHEITKIARKANESLTAFKERWTVETVDDQVESAQQSYTLESMEYSEASYNCCISQWYGILEQAEQLELLVESCDILYDNMK